MRPLTEILRFFTSLPRVLYLISTICLVVLVAMLFVEIVVRFFFGFSVLIAVDEVGGAVMMVFVLFSVAWIYKERGHLRVGIAADRLPDKPRRILEFVFAILSLVFIIFIIQNWLHMTLLTRQQGHMYNITHVPVWPIQMAALVGWCVLGIAILEDVVSRIRGFWQGALTERTGKR